MDAVGNCRVLSIQSHVVSGYVGNKCSTFPLQVRIIIIRKVVYPIPVTGTGSPVIRSRQPGLDPRQSLVIRA